MFGKQRKSALSQIQRNAEGKWEYTGYLCSYTGKIPRAKALRRLWVWSGLGTLPLLISWFLRVPGMTGYWYTLPPYIAGLVAAISALWSLFQLSMGKDPIREYILNTVKTWFPARAGFTVALAGLAFIGEIVFLCLHGPGPHLTEAVCHLVFMVVSLICFVFAFRFFKSMEWTRLETPTGNRAEESH